MIKKNIYLSIITLTKNENKKFLRTFKSIISQKRKLEIEWIIIDGSEDEFQKNNKELINKNLNKKNLENISINFVDSKKKYICGIYPCMNYAKRIALGKFIIFLNSGDTFYNENSLMQLFDNSFSLDENKSLVFGQANIFATKKINWLFPGNNLKNIALWLKFFEPNHQSMMISGELAKKYDFLLNYNLIADGHWKREIINNASNIAYVKKPVVTFFLDGVSTKKPSKKMLTEIIQNKHITSIRKLIFIIKYLFPKNIYLFYFKLQKFKSLLIDQIM